MNENEHEEIHNELPPPTRVHHQRVKHHHQHSFFGTIGDFIANHYIILLIIFVLVVVWMYIDYTETKDETRYMGIPKTIVSFKEQILNPPNLTTSPEFFKKMF